MYEYHYRSKGQQKMSLTQIHCFFFLSFFFLPLFVCLFIVFWCLLSCYFLFLYCLNSSSLSEPRKCWRVWKVPLYSSVYSAPDRAAHSIRKGVVGPSLLPSSQLGSSSTNSSCVPGINAFPPYSCDVNDDAIIFNSLSTVYAFAFVCVCVCVFPLITALWTLHTKFDAENTSTDMINEERRENAFHKHFPFIPRYRCTCVQCTGVEGSVLFASLIERMKIDRTFLLHLLHHRPSYRRLACWFLHLLIAHHRSLAKEVP